MYDAREKYILTFWQRHLKERSHLLDLVVDGRII
jgi:hypothetical protein